MPWSHLQRMVAFRSDIFVGQVVCIAAESAQGRTIHLLEGEPGWLGFMALYERHLPGAVSKAEWFLKICTGEVDREEIYARTMGHNQ